MTEQDFFEKYAYLSEFFEFTGLDDKNGPPVKLKFTCMKCLAVFSCPYGNIGNLKRHVTRKHQNFLIKYIEIQPGSGNKHIVL
jgi:hypothetical protein